jgi:oligopeptide/dipeptide ABC transporter ATP-binding protein
LANNILEVRDLVTRFYTAEGVIHAVNGVSFGLKKGETLGIVGESGCGKSVTILSLLRLISEPPGRIERGQALFNGRDLLKLSERELRQVRGGQIGMVFQDPMTSLNPMITIGDQIVETMLEHENINNDQAIGRSIELLKMVGIPSAEDRLRDYPHQFSGGMRQRVMIAIALACNPTLLIADEPTTALDVTIQAQILERVKELRDKFGMTVIWITHDLGVIAGLADQVIVIYAGLIVEYSDVWDLFANPKHPYTLGLLASLPNLNSLGSNRLANIEGHPPDMLKEPELCPFLPRCRFAIDRCLRKMPLLEQVNDNHQVACWVQLDQAESKAQFL